PNGAVELALDHILRTVATNGADYLTLGLAPLGHLDEGDSDNGGERPWVRKLLELCYEHLGFVYNFRGLYQFKRRMHPDHWVRQYALVPGTRRPGLFALLAVLLAFVDDVPRFAVETTGRILRHTPPRVWHWSVALLAGPLIPWTLLLAVVDANRWFGSEEARAAWVIFDSVMIVALTVLWWGLRRGWTTTTLRISASVLAAATLGDFILTVRGVLELGLMVWDWDVVFVVAGMGAPLWATLVLLGVARWGALARTQRR